MPPSVIKTTDAPVFSELFFAQQLFPELNPLLKWLGGKRWLVPHLKSFWLKHSYRRLVEPFCGGLAVSLGLSPDKALINDINSHLINFYNWVKKGLRINSEMKNEETIYYQYRKKFNWLIQNKRENTMEAALLFYYLNHTGYNGLCRFNGKGGFNVPYGKYKTINYRKIIEPYQKIFERWEFTTGDFEKMPLESEDFIYADPPYDVEFTQYSKEGFCWEDQVRLVEFLANHQGPVVLSNQATDRIVKLYKKFKFELIYIYAPRMISCNGDRTPAKEVLAIKGI